MTKTYSLRIFFDTIDNIVAPIIVVIKILSHHTSFQLIALLVLEGESA